jgi:hypothetical protein
MKKFLIGAFALIALALSGEAQNSPIAPSAPVLIHKDIKCADGLNVQLDYSVPSLGEACGTLKSWRGSEDPEVFAVTVNMQLPGVTRIFSDGLLYAVYDDQDGVFSIMSAETAQVYHAAK